MTPPKVVVLEQPTREPAPAAAAAPQPAEVADSDEGTVHKKPAAAKPRDASRPRLTEAEMDMMARMGGSERIDDLLSGATSGKHASASPPSGPPRMARGNRGLGSLSAEGGRGRAMAMPARRMAPAAQFNTEAYAHIEEQGVQYVKDSPLSTFSVDVDTASYSNVRRMIRGGQLPPADAVRIEEMINYFDYDYRAPAKGSEHPIAVHTEVSTSPWAPERRLVRIALQAEDMRRYSNAPRNLVFLVDVSGSMASEDKLPLLKRGLALLARDLRPEDSLAIVVYAGASGLALPATQGSDRETIMNALGSLEAGGSTNGAEGIELAYQIAQRHFVKGGVNRVVLATDGDFNVGVTSHGELVRLIEQKRKSGVFLTVLGFGTGNLKDSTMEGLADAGNGNYAYIDSIEEAHKVLVREAGSTLITVAKDVKLQIEWNPRQVASYRLIGYENRKLADRDFDDDKKDAGDMGAGHTVTALYDVTLAKGAGETRAVPALRYQADRAPTAAAHSSELLTVKIRYKHPNDGHSALLAQPVGTGATPIASASDDLRFAAAVAAFGMLLRHSEHSGDATVSLVRELVESATRGGATRERIELLELVDSAQRLGLGG